MIGAVRGIIRSSSIQHVLVAFDFSCKISDLIVTRAIITDFRSQPPSPCHWHLLVTPYMQRIHSHCRLDNQIHAIDNSIEPGTSALTHPLDSSSGSKRSHFVLFSTTRARLLNYKILWLAHPTALLLLLLWFLFTFCSRTNFLFLPILELWSPKVLKKICE